MTIGDFFGENRFFSAEIIPLVVNSSIVFTSVMSIGVRVWDSIFS